MNGMPFLALGVAVLLVLGAGIGPGKVVAAPAGLASFVGVGESGEGMPEEDPNEARFPKIAVAFFDLATDRDPKMKVLPWSELVDLLSRHQIRSDKDGALFSPTVYYSGGTRRNGNVTVLTLAVGDFDRGTVLPERVREHLAAKGLAFVIYSTHSTTPGLPKFRAVVPLLKPVASERWPHVWEALVSELFLGAVDLGTRDASRMFYLPSCPPGSSPLVYVGEGSPFDTSTLKLNPGHRRRPLTLPGEKGPIVKGERRPKLMSVAGRLRSASAGYDAILAELRAQNEARCDPKLPERDLEHIASSACRYEPGPKRNTSAPETPQVTRADQANPVTPPVPCASLAEALSIVARIVRTKDPVGSYGILAGAAQDWIIELLTSVFFVGFKGRTGAGKGTAVESTILLTRNGEILSNATAPYLNDLFNSGNTAVGFQQADKTIQRNEDIKTILLNGYRRGASSGIMVPASQGRGWVRSKLDIFGFKVYDFPVSIDTHLLNRSLVFDMEPDDSVDRALDGEDKAEALAPVRLWLEAQSVCVKQEWTTAKVRALRRDPTFRKRVADLKGAHGRDHVIGAALLLVSDLFGWDQEAASRQLLSRRRQIEDFSQEEEVRTYLEGIWDETPIFQVTFESVLVGLNEKRTKARQNTFSARGLSTVLQDLGFRKDSDEWFKPTSGPYRKMWVIRPGRFLTDIGGNGGNGGKGSSSDGERLPSMPPMPPFPTGWHPAPEAVSNVRQLFKRAAPEPLAWSNARSELARKTGISEAEYDGAVGGLLGSGELVRVSEGVFKVREGEP